MSLEICKELITSLLRNWQRNFRLERRLRFGIHFLTLPLIVIAVVWEPLNRALLHASHNSQKKIDGRKWAIKVNWSKPFKEDHHWIALLFQQLKLESMWMKTKEKQCQMLFRSLEKIWFSFSIETSKQEEHLEAIGIRHCWTLSSREITLYQNFQKKKLKSWWGGYDPKAISWLG